jgi:hypothetical protein
MIEDSFAAILLHRRNLPQTAACRSKPAVLCHRNERGGSTVKQKIVGFHQDEQGDWVADLACGHGQHVRHQPPLSVRVWATTEEGRQGRLGSELNCRRCDEEG